MDELIQDFISETFETLDALSGELVAWEADPSDSERLDNIFRFFHTVKGSCGFLNLPRFERLSHAAEDVLSKLRDGSIDPNPELVNAILAIVDRISELTSVLDSGDPLPDGKDGDLLERLEDACSETVQSVATTANVSLVNETVTDSHNPVRAIRIPLELLDHLMNGVSDMVLARNEVARRMRGSDDAASMDAAFDRLSTCIADMRDMIGKTRMQRIERIFSPLPRLIRDLNAELGKSVVLETKGVAVELDREMIDMIRDPLMHIVRNSIDHGIENTDDRVKANKPLHGRLLVEARQSGNQILIEISDDGRGIDVDALTAKAVAAKIIRNSDLANMSEQAKLNLIFSPGLTTAAKVTSISGRGVGMDVVHSNITRIGGSIDLENKYEKGLKITLRVPLTLTIIACLTIQAGDDMFALPRSSIQEILHSENENVTIETMGGGEIAVIRGVKVPHVTLEEILGLESEGDIHDAHRTIIAIDAGSEQKYALSVPAVLDHEELVIRPGSPLIMENGVYAGTTLPDNGRPMLLLDPSGIAAKLKIAGRHNLQAEAVAPIDKQKEKRSSALIFYDFAGSQRAIRLGIIERVEDIEASRIAISAGQMRVSMDGSTRPIYGLAEVPKGDTVKTLLLSDGEVSLYYAIHDVVDIFALSNTFEKAAQTGLVAGVTMVGEQQVEIIDTHWLFSQFGAASFNGSKDLPKCCIIGEDDMWTQHILAPLIESAGYEIVQSKDSLQDADVYISMYQNGEKSADISNEKPVIHLAYEPGSAGGEHAAIYRYDRKALMHALETNLINKKDKPRKSA